MKHYRVKEARGSPMRPWLLFGVRFDVHNVRSGRWDTLERNFQVEMVPLEDDLIWTPDMVVEHPRNFLDSHAGEIAEPAGFAGAGLQERLESKFLEYLLRHYRVVVQRNTFYDIYSDPFESGEDFRGRCLDRALHDIDEEFRALSDRYLRRLLQIEDSLWRAAEELEDDLEEPSRRKLEWSRVFLQLKERISTLCLERGSSERLRQVVACDSIPDVSEIRGKLAALQSELYLDAVRLEQSHLERAESIEPFPLALTLHQIDIVETAVLWQ